jgi:LCP family protein required for cell wall assembly
MKKFFITALSILLVLLIGTATYIYILLEQIEGEPLTDYPNPEPEELGISESAPKTSETGVTNILLFGLDARSQKEASRSDTIMIATIDKKNQAIKLTSLMRDMYIPIPGRDSNRINTAYAFGGPALAIKTVNTTFNLDIRYYATVNFFALEKVIDQVGGVEENWSISIQEHIKQYMGEGLNKKEAIRQVAEDRGMPKRQVYKHGIDIDKP